MLLRNQLITAVVAVLATGTVGALFAYFWNLRQKRRELGLSTQHEFYRLYGEFIAIWRIWHRHLKSVPLGRDLWVEDDKRLWELFDRAASAEAGVESVVVKAAATRKLDAEDVAVLGSFRQAYQSLRDSMNDGQRIEWNYDSAPGYAAFKYLSARTARLLAKQEPLVLPKADVAAANLRAITSNHWEAGNSGDWHGFYSDARWSDRTNLEAVISELREARSGSGTYARARPPRGRD